MCSGLAVCCLLLTVSLTMSAQSSLTTVVFTESTTWTVPAGVTSVTIECWGAGGGAAASSSGDGMSAYRGPDCNTAPYGGTATYPAGSGGAPLNVPTTTNTAQQGNSGSNYGGGGSGGHSNQKTVGVGGAGAPGFVRISYSEQAPCAISVALTADNTVLSAGQVATLTATPTPTTGTYTYIWTPAADLNAGTADNVKITKADAPAGDKTYTVKAIDENGCESETAAVTITTTSARNIAQGDWNCNTDTTLTINSTESGLPAGGTYRWQKLDASGTWVNITAANGETFSATASGEYRRGYTVGGTTAYTAAVSITHPKEQSAGFIESGGENFSHVCKGAPITLTIVSLPNELLNWEIKEGSSDWRDLNHLDFFYSPKYTSVNQQKEYRAYKTIGTNCKVYTNTFVIVVDALPSVENVSVDVSCPGKLLLVSKHNIHTTGVSETVTPTHSTTKPVSSYFAGLPTPNAETINANTSAGGVSTMPDVLAYVKGKFHYPEELADCTGEFTAAYTDATGVPSVGDRIDSDITLPPITVTDADGNTYETVRIGCECWTKSNLRATKYSDGTAVPFATGYTSLDYPDTDANIEGFGRLYSWYSAVNVPEGDYATVLRDISSKFYGRSVRCLKE